MFYQQNWHWFDNSQFTFKSESNNESSGALSRRVKLQSKLTTICNLPMSLKKIIDVSPIKLTLNW